MHCGTVTPNGGLSEIAYKARVLWDLTVTGAAYECLQRRCFNFSRCRIGSLVTEQIQLGESCSERLQNELKELSGRVSALEAAEQRRFVRELNSHSEGGEAEDFFFKQLLSL